MTSTSQLASLQPDNNTSYLLYIEGAAKYADPECDVLFAKNSRGLSISVIPSHTHLKQHMIDTLLEANRRMFLRIEYSKSLSISTRISYTVDMPDVK